MTNPWNEVLRCSQCESVGTASLFQVTGDDVPTLEGISTGFLAVRTESGFNFYCEPCNVKVRP